MLNQEYAANPIPSPRAQQPYQTLGDLPSDHNLVVATLEMG